MLLLDTNVISELRKLGDGKADANVVVWLSGHDAAHFFLSAISLMELEIGIARMERRDPRQGQRLRTWMEHYVLPEFCGRILAVDAAVALRCARLHVPDPKSDRDAYIAGTAMVHAMTIVTRNVADFASMPVPVVNPWDGPCAPPG